ncbi:MAG: hypothetical protein Q8N05_00895 [Bacteroidota bacterium]|nr:hypothetical protein [Bacteroidota bacterium]
MKHKLELFGIVGLAVLFFSSDALAQKDDKAKDKLETRHIKMMKIENGKKMELDTVITGPGVFVWHGDTIGGKSLGKPINFSGAKQSKQIIIRKGKEDGENNLMFMNGPNMRQFPPMPPMVRRKIMRGGRDSRVINLNDPNIISYKIKDIKGDREKIVIVRKKSEGPENMTFDINMDDELMPPPPPEAPEIIREFNNGEPQIKIIRKEKKMEGKNGKEIEVQVETKENK